MTVASAAGIVTIAAMLGAASTATAAPPDPVDRLKKIERERKANEKKHSVFERKADGVATEIQNLKVKMVRIADGTQVQEEAVSRLEAKISDLDDQIAHSTESLKQRREQMSAMLAAMERLSRHPPVALAARPGHPVDTVRSAILMRSAIPALESRSEALNRELTVLSSLREDVSRKRNELENAGRKLKNKRAELARLIDRKSRLERTARAQSWAAKARAATLAAEAKDLKDLLARLEAERQEALLRRKREEERRKAELERARIEAEREAAASRQRAALEQAEAEKASRLEAEREAAATSTVRLSSPPAQTASLSPDPKADNTAKKDSSSRRVALPARGKVVKAYGQRTGLGGAAKGLSIETRPLAQVTAPRQGDVVFAGPFRGYGLLVIIRHDDGHHALLSGMARIHAAVGDRVLAGEPVGLMGPNTGTRPTLYLELRRKGQPINPLPWLTASRSKVSG